MKHRWLGSARAWGASMGWGPGARLDPAWFPPDLPGLGGPGGIGGGAWPLGSLAIFNPCGWVGGDIRDIYTHVSLNIRTCDSPNLRTQQSKSYLLAQNCFCTKQPQDKHQQSRPGFCMCSTNMAYAVLMFLLNRGVCVAT